MIKLSEQAISRLGLGVLLIGAAISTFAYSRRAKARLPEYESALSEARSLQTIPKFYMWWEETRTSKPYMSANGEPGMFQDEYLAFNKKRIDELSEAEMQEYRRTSADSDPQNKLDIMVSWRKDIKLVPNTAWEPQDQETWVCSGYLPNHVRSRIPDNGRIEDNETHRIGAEKNSRSLLGKYDAMIAAERYTAAWRLLIDWEGQPLQLTDNIDGIFAVNSDAKYPFSLLKRIDEGSLPRPQRLEEAEHSKIRLAHPGQQEHGAVCWDSTSSGEDLIRDKLGIDVHFLPFHMSRYRLFIRFGAVAAMLFGIAGTFIVAREIRANVKHS